MKFKIIILVYCFFLKLAHVFSQTPQPIYSFATQLQPVKWYNEQVIAWKNEITKNNQNAYAWYNYYRATRNLARLDTNDKHTSKEKYEIEKKIVEDMGKVVPESFEYNLCKWMIGGNSLEFLPYLKKAAELGENRKEIVSEMINWGETERNIEMRNKYAKKWFESDLSSPGLLNYNYNVLTGLKQNAIIMTAGDNDTYPLWQLQSQGIRKDVTVINLYLINIDSYRDKIFKELGIPKWDTAKHSEKSINGNNSLQSEIIKVIAGNNKKFPVYVALTADESFIKSVENNLYITGLTYEYSTDIIDNLASLKKNFEQLYALDYIEHSFYKDISEYYTTCVNQNYIVPMLKLYTHYKESGDTQKQDWIKRKIIILAKNSENEAEILKHF